MSQKHYKEDRSIKGTLGLRPPRLRSASQYKRIDLSSRRLLEPDGVAGHRRALLHGTVLAIVFLAAATSVLFHEARPAAGQTAAPSTSTLTAAAIQPNPAAIPATEAGTTTAQSAANGAPAASLPVLAPPVQSLTQSPAPSTGDASQTAAATPAPSPLLPDPSAELVNAPSGAGTASGGGRLTRAQALPEVPFAAGAGTARPGGGTATATTLAQQYSDHTVVAGETLSSIAQSYSVSLDSLMANNPGIDDFDLIRPGQTLRIPSTNGLVYNVQDGDTLGAISQRYGISVDDIVALRANGLQSADTIVAGQTLLLPGDIKPPKPTPILAKALPAPAAPSGAPQVIAQAAPAPDGAAAASTADLAAPKPAPAPTPAPAPPVPVARFIWPIQGPITQPFGVPELGVGSPHTGIDIGLYGRDGTPIAAASAGTVEFAGGSPCCGFGNYVMIKHAGGFETLYGHLSGFAVHVGQQVTQGQTIGYAGDTGFSTGTHLHFEIHLNGALQNPLNYLP